MVHSLLVIIILKACYSINFDIKRQHYGLHQQEEIVLCNGLLLGH